MARNGTVDRIESAANITVIVSRGEENPVTNFEGSLNDGEEIPDGYIQVPISRLDTTKEVEISEIRESSLKASGYSITSISYSGSMMFKGSRYTKHVPDSETPDGEGAKAITNFFYNDGGVPCPFVILINHDLNDEPEAYYHVLVNSEGYEVRNESETETSFDWVAMDRDSDQPS